VYSRSETDVSGLLEVRQEFEYFLGIDAGHTIELLLLLRKCLAERRASSEASLR